MAAPSLPLTLALTLLAPAGATPAPAPAPLPESPRSRAPLEVEPYVTLTTGFGGGARTDADIGVLGGDVLVGAGALVGLYDVFVVVPALGWSGWRTLDRPNSLRANALTLRLDLGWFNLEDHLQGLTFSCAGRFGTGRDLAASADPARLRAVQAGVMWWPYRGVVGLELQSNFTHHLGAWRHDLRAVVNLNLIWAYAMILEQAMSPRL